MNYSKLYSSFGTKFSYLFLGCSINKSHELCHKHLSKKLKFELRKVGYFLEGLYIYIEPLARKG